MLADRTHCPWVYATPHLKELSAIMTAGSVMIHMWLMAHAMGLGACLCNFQLTDPDDEAIIANYLGVDYPRWRLAGLMVFGWPLKPRRGPPRRAVEEVTFAEKWGEPYKMEKTFDW
jgi:nitroreductase